MSKVIAEKKEFSLVDPSAFDDYAEAGLGKLTRSDVVIPRIAVLSSLSPQLKKNKAEYIEGSEEGDIVDVAMNRILAKGLNDEAFLFLPVVRVKECIVWKPRSSGGGIVSREVIDDMEHYAAKIGATRNVKGAFLLPDGTEAIETIQFYGLVLSGDYPSPAFIPMKKSSMKVARKWTTKLSNTLLPSGKRAPLFYRSWNIGAFLDSNADGEWGNFRVTEGPLLNELPNASDVFTAATELLKVIQSGEFKADLDQETDDSSDNRI